MASFPCVRGPLLCLLGLWPCCPPPPPRHDGERRKQRLQWFLLLFWRCYRAPSGDTCSDTTAGPGAPFEGGGGGGSGGAEVLEALKAPKKTFGLN